MSRVMTSREEVLLAALNLQRSGKQFFTEWDLTVETWKLNNQRWGLPGYRKLYPDHKRVMNEIMAKGSNKLLSQGFLKRVKINTYQLTPSGSVYAENIIGDKDERERAPYKLYDNLSKYLKHNAIKQFQNDRNKPSLWLHVASFYGLSATMTIQQASAKINDFLNTINQGEVTIEKLGNQSIRRISSGPFISKKEIELLKDFHKEMTNRFITQFEALLNEK